MEDIITDAVEQLVRGKVFTGYPTTVRAAVQAACQAHRVQLSKQDLAEVHKRVRAGLSRVNSELNKGHTIVEGSLVLRRTDG